MARQVQLLRVQANRLRKHLAELYEGEGASHQIRISVPVGQYAPVFEPITPTAAAITPAGTGESSTLGAQNRPRYKWMFVALVAALTFLAGTFYFGKDKLRPRATSPVARQAAQLPESPVGLPVGNEIRILAGGTRSYVDRSGKLWSPEAVPGSRHPAYLANSRSRHYRNSRQGDFSYNIPLSPGIYELQQPQTHPARGECSRASRRRPSTCAQSQRFGA